MKSKVIYVVDDQPGVLLAIGMLLRLTNVDCEVVEFSNPFEAIVAVRQRSPNLVLADQTMPGMLGSQMLDEIRQIAPQTVRIILSGHAVHTNKLASAHQYLVKPFKNKELIATIKNALVAQESLRDDLAKLVASLRSFPVLPHVYSELIQELDREDSSSDRLVELLNRDGGILTRLIQVANSPLFRGSSPVTDATTALFQLGTSHVKALVLSLHVFDQYRNLSFPEMPLDLLWQHSLETAQLARQLCRSNISEQSANDAFFAGLVHGMGRLILIENQPDAYRTLCRQVLSSGQSLSVAEKEHFGASHSELAAFMLRLWGVAPAIIEAVECCDQPLVATLTLPSALSLANAYTRLKNSPDQLPTRELDPKELAQWGIGDSTGGIAEAFPP